MARVLFLGGLLLLAFLPGLAAAQPSVTSGPPCGTLAPTGADDTARLQAAVLKAEALPARCLTLTAGRFQISGAAGALVTVAVDHFDLRGAGAGLTVLDFPPAQLLTDRLAVLTLAGADDRVQALSITGHTFSGPGQWVGITTAPGADRPVIRDVEISGFWGAATPGGGGIDLYQPWFIRDGQLGALVDHVYLHDGQGFGLGVTANGNTVQNSTFTHIGVNGQQHCIYLTGGYNRIAGNRFDTCSGYSIHGFYDVAHLDASGNVITGNTSHNPGTAHVIAGPWPVPEDGTNPHLPPGSMNGRFVTIADNVFTNQDGNRAWGIEAYLPAVISGNTFEDVGHDGEAVILSDQPSTITGNAIRTLVGGAGWDLISRGPGSTISANQGGGPWQISGAGSLVSGNTVGALQIGGAVTATGNTAQTLALSGTGFLVADTRLLAPGVALQVEGAGLQGVLRGNTWGLARYDGPPAPGLVWDGNSGTVSAGGYTALPVTAASGRLSAWPVGGAWLTRGQIVALQDGALVPATGARWLGVTPTDAPAGTPGIWIVAQPGARLAGVCGAAALPVGHVGIVGALAGCLVDGGWTMVDGGSYARAIGNGEVELWP